MNVDYMRVYVPGGSKLLEVSGQTREFVEAPLDYDALGFTADPDVIRQESSMSIDHEGGTRIYDEQDKTVFANWVYVSPGETVEVEYKYLLPFKIDFDKNSERVDSYSLLAQKQSGSDGSIFNSSVELESEARAIWKYPSSNESSENENTHKFSETLNTDQLLGIVFQDKAE